MDSVGKGNKSEDESESPEEEEEVDPRIQGELEKLNQSTDDINRWETELEEARQKFRAVLVEATLKLDDQVKKIGKAVEESKPYWEARRDARQAQLEAQRATQDYQGAIEVLRAAKETISLAEQRLLEEDSRQFDSAWQEMLNHATQRVMEAEQTKARSELVHKQTAAKYDAALGHMMQLEKRLKRTVSKSRPYFELKAKYYLQLEQLKKKVDDRQAKLSRAKGEYRAALRNLEKISDEIHARRRSSVLECRGHGVGAEGDNENDQDADITNFRMESDGLSMVSVSIEDESSSSSKLGEEPEVLLMHRLCLLPTGSAEQPWPCVSPSPSSSSSSSQASIVNLSASVTHSALGPRGECSGASSPECDLEPEHTTENIDSSRQKIEAGASSLFNGNIKDQPSLQCPRTDQEQFAKAQNVAPSALNC